MCPICRPRAASLVLKAGSGESVDAALAMARLLVVLLERPDAGCASGGRSETQGGSIEAIRRVQRWIRDNLRSDLSVAQLALRTGMSQRNFARAFVQEAHMTPAQFVDLTRIDAARRLLDGSALSLQRIAFECGFSNTQTLRRAFLRHLEIGPREYLARVKR
jgi:transcriptional regulator GlxA family with amidase domain